MPAGWRTSEPSHERILRHGRIRRLYLALLLDFGPRADRHRREVTPCAGCRAGSRLAPRPSPSKSGVMIMTARQRRMCLVALILLGVGVAIALGLTAFQDNLLYFYLPSQVVSGEAPADRLFRMGGMVTKGSVQREPGSME